MREWARIELVLFLLGVPEVSMEGREVKGSQALPSYSSPGEKSWSTCLNADHSRLSSSVCIRCFTPVKY